MVVNPYPVTFPFTPVAPGGSGATGVFPPGTEMLAPPGTPTAPTSSDPNVAKWDEYIATIKAALAASSGWNERQLAAQLADAEKARANAMEIARLNAQTSRYGTNVNAMVQLRQLEQQQRQFEANHGLEIAKAYTQYASTPDLMWAHRDFTSALANVGQGRSPQSVASQPAPRAKTWQDFAALAGYGGNSAVAAGAGGGQAQMMAGGAGGAGGADPRLKAMKAIGDAIPPSDTPGNDDQDWAAINAIANLYFAGRPGEVERLGRQRRKTTMAGLARASYDPLLVEEERVRGLPNRGNPRAA